MFRGAGTHQTAIHPRTGAAGDASNIDVAMISRGLLHLESASDEKVAAPPLPTARSATAPARLGQWHEFDDSTGVAWRVFELPAGSAGHMTWSACLIFESDNAVRRVRNFPPHWSALSAVDLERVSWER